MVVAHRSQRAGRSRHAQGRADAIGRARRSRRPRLHQRAHRRRAAVGQRRVLREDRQGKVHAAAADSVGQRRAGRAPTTPKKTPTSCSTRPSGRSSRLPKTGCGRASCASANWSTPAISSSSSCRASAGWSRACRAGSCDLDEMTSGFQKSDLVIVAARPSMGKTSFVLNMALHCGDGGGQDASASSASRCRRSSCSCACSRPRRAWTRTGSAAGSSASRTTRGSSRRSRGCTTRRSSSTTRPSVGILEMRAKARRLKLEHGLDMLVIDYLQLMQGRGRFDNRQQELASISRSLKILAKELDIPILALSQLSRAPEARARSSAAAVGPARVRRARAGRRRRAVHLPRGDVPRGRRAQSRDRRHGRDHHRQAAQRPDRHRCGSRFSSSTRGSRTWRGGGVRPAGRMQ